MTTSSDFLRVVEITTGSVDNVSTYKAISVHRDLLESSSDFFRKAFKSEQPLWKEGEQNSIQLQVNTTALKVYANWLYHVGPDPSLSWSLLVECYVFSLEYLIEEFTRDLICLMLYKWKTIGPWYPTASEIERVYENTSTECDLRKLVVVGFSKKVNSRNISATRISLAAAPNDFVCDFAMFQTLGARSRSYWDYINTSNIYNFPWASQYQAFVYENKDRYRIEGFEDIIYFDLEDSNQHAIIHVHILGKTEISRRFCHISCEPIKLQGIKKEVFKIFASWLYFDDDLSDSKHECQTSPDMMVLLHCYKLAVSLDSIDQCISPLTSQNERVKVLLQFQSARFMDAIIDAIVSRYKKSNIAPSEQEKTLLYYITDPGDPLRQLFADIMIWRHDPGVLDNPLFQTEITKNLFQSHIKMRAYVKVNRDSPKIARFMMEHVMLGAPYEDMKKYYRAEQIRTKFEQALACLVYEETI